jgi:type IV secretion system protein VirD4
VRAYPLFLGASRGRWVFAQPQSALLVIGPPRSGKTTSVVIPNVLAAAGAVVSTSTKLDVLEATRQARARSGTCFLFDPAGVVEEPAGVTRLRWSPICGAGTWEGASSIAKAMVEAARPAQGVVDSWHWTNRAQFLLAPLLHAAALGGMDMDRVLSWVNRRTLGDPMRLLEGAGHGARFAVDALYSIAATEDRERSSILSTASVVLSSYLSDPALSAARRPNFDPRAFPGSTDTVYVCAPGRAQSLVGPIIVGLLEEIRSAAYARALPGGAEGPPVMMVLDEVANIAPLPDLPSIVSEGAGQGLLSLVCLQDLSQARARWGREAEGFASLFGAKLVLPGIGDMATLETLSALCGEVDVPVRSRTLSGAWWRPSAINQSVTWSARRQRRMPVDAVSQGVPGKALYLQGGEEPAMVELTPWHATPAWQRLAEQSKQADLDRPREARRSRGLSRRVVSPATGQLPPPGAAPATGQLPAPGAGWARDEGYGREIDGLA